MKLVAALWEFRIILALSDMNLAVSRDRRIKRIRRNKKKPTRNTWSTCALTLSAALSSESEKSCKTKNQCEMIENADS